ncbi:sulfite oxidase-like oxidoreductase [Planktothrix mougeotii]|uniref:Sulfite oxidase-like oxidoreductase n=1 Tax=Planktothrix mougeotii LEGE 06226 TaxID=1828728 RepID=A0ABR9U6U0_9CYAN|nr:sulfite oxidase-like oxidoreductase [Planktothrix mougeotii]MBE9142142.1 sulfite oxidase-like oxidoreductase [Planktothrix mougeotii LEGE 06226]
MLGQFFHKPTSDESARVPPGQHLSKGFPVLTYGETPEISLEDWQLKVWGLAIPKTFTWSDLMAMPKSNFTADFHCVTHWSKLEVKWTGIKVTDFMKFVEVSPQAIHVMEHCYGGYTTNVSMEDFLREDNFFAYEVFDEPLPPDHGGPLRLVVPHLYAWKSGKWINGLEFMDHEELGFWEQNGYHKRGEPWAEERYSD